MSNLPDDLPSLDSLHLPAPDNVPSMRVSTGTVEGLAAPARQAVFRRKDTSTSLQTSIAPVASFSTLAMSLKEAAGHYKQGLPPVENPLITFLKDIRATHPTMKAEDVQHVTALRDAITAIDKDGIFNEQLTNMMIAHTLAHDAKSLDDGNAAHWLLRVVRTFESGVFKEIQDKDFAALKQSGKWLDGWAKDGLITAEQQAILHQGVIETIARYEKIIPLLQQAKDLIPDYMARVDAGALGQPYQGQAR